ncbi:hypothetical protein Pcinc_035496 [Petrolisthes cinctipes]|uniref:Uncharacterized protein n=1 Tax=Petrolisthes cinctipes TaxID=88211 RepID=A0AAE1EMX2_PETCI|nr:hypothetical protein Pcinc_035496 [Petrolisthes cinctipes]
MFSGPGRDPLCFPPDVMSWSNMGFQLQGRIVERDEVQLIWTRPSVSLSLQLKRQTEVWFVVGVAFPPPPPHLLAFVISKYMKWKVVVPVRPSRPGPVPTRPILCLWNYRKEGHT